jgi:hypothetical protein
MTRTLVVLLLLWQTAAIAQYAELRPADPIFLPGVSDSNSPVHWWNETFYVIQSTGLPIISHGANQAGPLKARAIILNSQSHTPLWIESTWVDDDGTVYAWYHHESRVCNGLLSVPSIGALISRDGGIFFEDLGIILETGEALDCGSPNGYFAGGHGDFTVLLDSARQFFYIYFGNYSGPPTVQGIAVARLAFADRARPVGRVWKFHEDGWRQPGLKGRITAFLQPAVPWNAYNTDAFWGPSLHWNTFLNQYVMLLNRSCCEPGWPSEGTYVSFNPNLDNPAGWNTPAKILSREQSRWYPAVIGLEPGGTDKEAGEVARLYVGGDSHWEIVFSWQPPQPQITPQPEGSRRITHRVNPAP